KPSDTDFEVFTINSVSTEPRTLYGISSKSTLLTLNRRWWDSDHASFKVIRKTSVLVQSELLPAAAVPIVDTVKGDTLTLDAAYLNLQVGDFLILTGERTDLPAVVNSELCALKAVVVEKGFTVVTFTESLKYEYIRSTVLLNANVALATH